MSTTGVYPSIRRASFFAIVVAMLGLTLTGRVWAGQPCLSFDPDADPKASPMGPWMATACPDPNRQCGITAPTEQTPRPWIVISTFRGKYWGHSDFKTRAAAQRNINTFQPIMNYGYTDRPWTFLGPFPKCDEDPDPNDRATLWGPITTKAAQYKRQYDRTVAEVRRYFREGKKRLSVKFLGELYVAQSEAENLIAAVSNLHEDSPDSEFAEVDQALTRYRRAFDRLKNTRQNGGLGRIPAVPDTNWTRIVPARTQGRWTGTFSQQDGYAGNAELRIGSDGAVQLKVSYRIAIEGQFIAETLEFKGSMILSADKRSFRASLTGEDGTTAEVEGTVSADGTLTGTYFSRVWVPPQPEINFPGHYETDTGPFTLHRNWNE